MSKTKPVSLLHQATASMLVALMALPNFVVAETLRQIALAAPEPGVNAPRVTLQLAPPPGATGQVFVVQTSTNLVDWQPLTNASPNQVQLLSVGPLMALDPARFFRAATLAGEPPARQPLFAAVADDSGRAYVFPYLGDRTFGPRVEVANVGGGSRGVAIGDFDRDGNLDVVASFPGPGNTFRTLLIRGRADGTFAPGEPMPAVEGSGGHVMDMAVGDFDADGGLDVAINGNSDTTALYWGRGDGTFTVTTVRWPGTGRGMTAGDFNEDGRTDLVRASYSDGNTRLYLSNGDRTFAAPILVGRHGSDPYGVASVDFDQDGHLDVIANAGGNGDIIIYQGFGDGTFTNLAAGDAFAPLDFNDYAALDPYDFDGDGFPDMVVATYGGRAAYFVPGAAGGGFETNRVTLATGLSTALGAAAPPPPPRVEVNLAPLDPVIDLNGQVTFTAVGAGVQAGDTFRWTFGDEGDNPLAWSFTPDMANMGPTVTHQFEREGRFVTRLWHTDARGIHSARGTWVTVKGQPPVAQPGGPYVFGEDKAQALVWTATLDGSASTDDFGIVRYEWDFGDGTKGTNRAPVISKSWNGVGPWDVTLVVEDASGLRGTNTTTVTFVPGEAPVARITGPALVDETAAKDGQWTVNFSAAASTDDVGLWKYEWQFGDGKTAAGRDVTTRYGAVGTYTVTLTVTDHAGQTNAVTHDVTIKANEPPVPVITGPRLLTETVATNGLWYGVWNARASTDDTGIYRYEWTFGDGGTATGIEVAYQYKRAGTYPLTLKVTDNGNQTATVEINVLVVPGESPVARITASPLAPEGRQPVAFSAERSSDDRGITSYRWLFPPRTFDFAGRVLDAEQWAAAGASQDERISVTGQGQWGRTYFFSLPTRLQRGGSIEGRVDTPTGTSHAMVGLKNLDVGNGQYSTYPYAIYFEDGRLSVYEYGSRRQIVVGNYTKGESYDVRIRTLPGAGAEYFLRRSGVGEDFALVFSSNQRDDAAFSFGADVHSGTFGFDDFTVTGAFVSAMTVSAPVFPGGPVRLEVVDHAWQTNATAVTITPRVGQPPRAVINGPTTGQAGVVLNFDGYRSTDDHGIASYSWDFGDGTPLGAGPAVNHRYDAPGTYTNTLTVLDYANQPATAQLVVEITTGNAVACVPWRIINGVEQPHETFSGKEVTLKAVARNLPLPFDYIWNFGDGTGSVTNTATTVAQAYALEARHVYSGTEGTPFYATITVVLTNGVTLGDTYPLVLRPKSLTTEMNVAIDEGLWYLHKIQTRTDGDGQNLSGHWPAEGHTVNPTASAIQAFGINGHQYADDVAQDPYVETVQRGVHFLLNSLTTQGIGPQPYGDPDGNQNGIALFAPTAHPIYETGPLMDAFVACVRPELIAPVGPANVRGRAFRDIMQDLVDIYTWGQYDDATVGGGWRYGWNQHPDNSAAQWGAIGLLAAEHYWGSIVPQWVKDRNVVWVNYSKGANGFGYTGPGDGEATTPSAMVQLAWAGVARTNALWQHGETYLARNWNTLLNNYNLYGHYAIAKALRTAVPEPVQNLTWQGTTWDWFLDPQRGLGRFTVDRQRADGSWTSRDGWVDEPPIATAYSVIILSSSLFQRGPVAVIQFRPNPSAVGFPVVFDARASYHQHPAYQVVEYRWDFNAADGLDFSRPDAVGPVVTNTYSALGTNVVTLQVRDNNVPVLTDIASVEVRTTIPPFPPTADAGGPYVVAVGEDLQLDGSGSFDVDAAAGDYLTAWDWEVDFEMPLDFDDGVTGEKAVLAGGFATAGLHRIGLRVSDATSIVFPELGLTNLTAEDFTSAFVYERVVTDLRVRPKENKVQLTWTKAGDYAVVLRSTVGPQRGFVEIGRTESDYATFLDTNVVMGVEYFYRLLVYSFSRPDPLGVSDVRLAVSRPRDADNRPPAFLSTPLRLGQVGRLYEVTLEAADPDGDALTFGILEGPTNLTVNPATGLVQFTPTEDQLGSQTLSFEVRAEGGRDVLTYSVVVFPADNAAPTASANGPYVAVLGEPIQFSSAGTADPDGHNLRIIWNFGDGRSSTNANPVHVYTAAGNYLASLFVNDGYGGTATARANVSILRPNRAPTAVIAGGLDFAIRLGETLTLDGTGSFDLDGDELAFTWNWGDGIRCRGAVPGRAHLCGSGFVRRTTSRGGRARGCWHGQLHRHGRTRQPAAGGGGDRFGSVTPCPDGNHLRCHGDDRRGR
ncbi:MAG: PKD domain-containing protein [Verrucomicrobia bacterium]|nr:PKD domain-containing protein [Verrucomicrobiota bacterium]